MKNEKAEYSSITEEFLYGKEFGVEFKELTTDIPETIYISRRLERIADALECIADVLMSIDKKGITVYPEE